MQKKTTENLETEIVRIAQHIAQRKVSGSGQEMGRLYLGEVMNTAWSQKVQDGRGPA